MPRGGRDKKEEVVYDAVAKSIETNPFRPGFTIIVRVKEQLGGEEGLAELGVDSLNSVILSLGKKGWVGFGGRVPTTIALSGS